MDRNSKSRLRAVNRHIDKALDSLHRAQGELYPAALASFRSDVSVSIEKLTALKGKAETVLEDKETESADQLDIEGAIARG